MNKENEGVMKSSLPPHSSSSTSTTLSNKAIKHPSINNGNTLTNTSSSSSSSSSSGITSTTKHLTSSTSPSLIPFSNHHHYHHGNTSIKNNEEKSSLDKETSDSLLIDTDYDVAATLTSLSNECNTNSQLTDFVLIKVVGKGSFGKVMQVRKKDSGVIYAMKVFLNSIYILLFIYYMNIWILSAKKYF